MLDLFTCKTKDFASALGRTRTCDLLIRSHSPSQTGRDREGQGETKQRFYRKLILLKGQGGTGRDTRLRSDCGQNLALSRRINEAAASDLGGEKRLRVYPHRPGRRLPFRGKAVNALEASAIAPVHSFAEKNPSRQPGFRLTHSLGSSSATNL